MALVVEDGTGIDGANSYVTVDEADAYWSDRNMADWAGVGATIDDKEGLLIQGADYLNQFYIVKGEELVLGQSMGLPTMAYDYIPPAFKQAQIILAKEAKDNGPLSSPMGDRLVTSERKKLDGVGEKEVNYERSNVDRFGRIGSSVDALLSQYTIDPDGISIQQARVDYS